MKSCEANGFEMLIGRKNFCYGSTEQRNECGMLEIKILEVVPLLMTRSRVRKWEPVANRGSRKRSFELMRSRE